MRATQWRFAQSERKDTQVHLGDVGEDDWKVRTPKKVPGFAPEGNVFEGGKVAA